MAKVEGNKTDSPKKMQVPTSIVCAVCKCSPELVRKSRNGKLSGNGMASNRVAVAELLLEEGLADLVKRVTTAIEPFTTQTRTNAAN